MNKQIEIVQEVESAREEQKQEEKEEEEIIFIERTPTPLESMRESVKDESI